jgi:hypothetical protein
MLKVALFTLQFLVCLCRRGIGCQIHNHKFMGSNPARTQTCFQMSLIKSLSPPLECQSGAVARSGACHLGGLGFEFWSDQFLIDSMVSTYLALQFVRRASNVQVDAQLSIQYLSPPCFNFGYQSSINWEVNLE